MTGLLNAATTCGAEPLRTQEPSSAIVMFLTWCSPFSIPEWPRTTWSSLSQVASRNLLPKSGRCLTMVLARSRRQVDAQGHQLGDED